MRQRFAILKLRFGFHTGLVPACTSFCLVSDGPLVAVFADTQYFATGAQLSALRVVERVDFMGARRDELESGGAKFAHESVEVGDAEFYFDLLRRGHEKDCTVGRDAACCVSGCVCSVIPLCAKDLRESVRFSWAFSRGALG